MANKQRQSTVLKGLESITGLFGSAPGNQSTGSRGSFFIGGNKNAPRLTAQQLLAGYRQFPWLRMVIDKIAELAGEVEWKVATVEEVTEDGQERLLVHPDHPLSKVLNSGNSEFSGLAMRQLAFKELCILGEVAWLKEFDSTGKKVVELWPIPPTWIKELPIQNKNQQFKLEIGGKEGEVDPKRIIYIRIPDPSNPYLRGSGVAETVADELSIDELSAKYVKQYFFNSARPDLLVWSEEEDSPFNEEDAERLEETWLSKLQGFVKSHRPFFLPGKVGVKDISSKLKDLDVGNLRKASRDIVLQSYGLPPESLGILDASNRATITAAAHFLTKFVILPKLKFVRAELERTLLPDFAQGKEKIRLIFDSPVTEDVEMQADLIKSAPWAFKVDEIRQIAQFQPEGGDEGNVRALPVNMFFATSLVDFIKNHPMGESGKGPDGEPVPADKLVTQRTALLQTLLVPESKKSNKQT